MHKMSLNSPLRQKNFLRKIKIIFLLRELIKYKSLGALSKIIFDLLEKLLVFLY